MHKPVKSAGPLVWRKDGFQQGRRAVPEETALAITYNGGTYAVMMGSPLDLRDFAIGFSLSEGVVTSVGEIRSLEIVAHPDGVELQMWLADDQATQISARRRRIAGPTGCGLCGVESLEEAVKPAALVAPGGQVTPEQIMAAMQAMAPLQLVNIETRAVHAAAFWRPGQGIVALREDVGRHNALDKLAGAMAVGGISPDGGMVLLSSRVSVEMVQKTAAIGAAIMICVSAPTALAIRMADAAGITLVAVARSDGFEVFTHPARIAGCEAMEVAHVA